jgi:hypothetical protein
MVATSSALVIESYVGYFVKVKSLVFYRVGLATPVKVTAQCKQVTAHTRTLYKNPSVIR